MRRRHGLDDAHPALLAAHPRAHGAPRRASRASSAPPAQGAPRDHRDRHLLDDVRVHSVFSTPCGVNCACRGRSSPWCASFCSCRASTRPLTSPEQRRCAPMAQNGRESSPRAKGHRASSPRPRMPMPDGPPPSNPVQRRLRKRLMARWKVLEETFRTRHPPLPECMLVTNADVTKISRP